MTTEYSENVQKLFPKDLSSRHRKVMRMEIAGHTTNDIASELGFNVQRLSVIMNSPLYVDEREKMRRDVDREFAEAEGKQLSMDTTHERLAYLQCGLVILDERECCRGVEQE